MASQQSKRTRDAWGAKITEDPRRDAWGASPRLKRDAWGGERKPAQPALLPDCTRLFKPVEKLEGQRAADAWGTSLPEKGMPSREFNRAVAEAQAAIFAKARPSRASDQDAAGYVDAMTRVIREKATTDAGFVEALRDCGTWAHNHATTAPAPKATAPARTETRRVPLGTTEVRGSDGRITYVRETSTTSEGADR